MADALRQDLRHAVRSLARRPVFSVSVALVLAVGLGASAILFGLVDGVVLQPLDLPASQELIEPFSGQTWWTKAQFVLLRENAQAYRPAAYFSWAGFTLDGDLGPEHVAGAQVTSEYFDVLGATPVAGSFFRPGDDAAGAAPTAVLSEELWRSRFGGDPALVGASLRIDGEPVTVLGVAPSSFGLPREETGIWRPLTLDPAQDEFRNAYYIQFVARVGGLASGASADVVRSRAEPESARLAALIAESFEMPSDFLDTVGPPRTLHEALVGDLRPVLLALLVAAAAVLLVVTVNVANLLLARGAGRRRELAVRRALGGGGWKLVRLLLTESVTLAALGGALALGLAALGLPRFASLLPEYVPRTQELAVDARTALFVVLSSLIAGVVFGALPALRLLHGDLASSLREGASGGLGRSRLHGTLVVAEIALAFVLVVGAGLVGRSFWTLAHVDPGFDAAQVLTFRPVPLASRYPDRASERALMARVEERLEALPGVDAVGSIHMVPVLQRGFNGRLHVDGRDNPPEQDAPLVNWRVVTPGYFEALRIPVEHGRALTMQDAAEAPQVVLVNRAFAELHLPGEEPVGRKIRVSLEWDRWAEIVGVVGDVRQHGLEVDVRPEVYRPAAQVDRAVGTSFMVRASRDGATDPRALVPAVRAALAEIDPTMPLVQVEPLEAVVWQSLAGPRLGALVFAAFGALALALAAVGIYAVIAFEVGQRIREMGLRMALGARGGDVVRLVLRRVAWLGGVGLALGLAAALAGGRWVAALLYEVRAADPAVLASVCLLLTLVAAGAALRPALRAARVDPLEALRDE